MRSLSLERLHSLAPPIREWLLVVPACRSHVPRIVRFRIASADS